MEVRFGYTILYVENVETTITFYENAFGFKRKFMTPEKDYAELVSGDTTIAFADLPLARSNFDEEFQVNSVDTKPAGFELAFVTDDVPALYDQAISAGAFPLREVTLKPWGQQVGYLKDKNGFIIEICSSMDEK